ncbi:peptide deformylase [Arenibacter sp. GZD96]|uniref:peptide deformylase n=1 Tax=Aurantibrevibacter litoralis TaxID=3106030 RepID=UPI002AFEA7F2|nr:peptide deformylase [Arenibacter sp. GZD-96]MEA1787128.1 peptide deformylase [Arenibacter sp. GZD-96]
MILPIVAYGDPVLRKVSNLIDADYPDLKSLIEAMWETMYNAHGVGLAAPQIGKAIRLFVVDTTAFGDDDELAPEEQNALKNFKKVFINAQILEESGKEWLFNEGCLSIPDIREDVARKERVTISYMDANFIPYTETYDGLLARVIQHEYDHIQGILFTDKLSTLKKTLLKTRLANISKGKIKVDYRMRFPDVKKGR